MATATPQQTATMPSAKASHEEFPRPTVFARLASALRRRTNYWAGRIQGPARHDHAERSLHWLLNHGEQILAESGQGDITTPLNSPVGATAGLPSSASCIELRAGQIAVGNALRGVPRIAVTPGTPRRAFPTGWVLDEQIVHRVIRVLNSYGQHSYAEAWSARLRPSEESPQLDTQDPASQALDAYHQGDRTTGDTLMQRVRHHQLADGSFNLDQATTASHRIQQLTTVLSFLEAAQLQVTLTFASGADPVYADIDANDPRAQEVTTWFATLDACDRVADIGCGSGRFLRLLANQDESRSLVGIDPALECSHQLSPRVEHRTGGLLHLPAADAEFDAAFAVESLEHALVPQTAIAELCRVVRPGGHLLIIDKNAQLQPLSEHAPWERWFHPEEVCRWLWRHCDHVQVTPLHDPSHPKKKPSFLAWHGRRKP